MTTKVISNTSGQKTVSNLKSTTVLETAENDGIKHTLTGHVDTSNRTDTYLFVGYLIVTLVGFYLTGTSSSISTAVGGEDCSCDATFQHNLTAHYAEVPPPEKISFDEMFAASDKTDGILVVEGKKLNVNKAFLSFHSDYFSTLFSSNFQEGQMKEIEIKEVSYEDFGLLLSSFYPNPQFPNDHTVEKLLEMARRFQVSSVIGIVEYHLLYNSKIGYEKMLWFADEYKMPKLLEKCISQLDSSEKAKKLKNSPEFEKLSVNTRSLILGRLMEFI